MIEGDTWVLGGVEPLKTPRVGPSSLGPEIRSSVGWDWTDPLGPFGERFEGSSGGSSVLSNFTN